MLPDLFNTMSRVKPKCKCINTPEKGTKFIDTLDDIKGENAKVDDPINRLQIPQQLEIQKMIVLI